MYQRCPMAWLLMSTGLKRFEHVEQSFISAVHYCAKYFGFFSSCSLKTREKFISFVHLVFLSLYIFWGKCVYFSIFELPSKNIQTEQNWLTKTNIGIFLSFWGIKRRKTNILLIRWEWTQEEFSLFYQNSRTC